MKFVSKITFLVTLVTSFYLLTEYTFAQPVQNEEVILFHESAQQTIDLYEDESFNRVLQKIPDDTLVTLLEEHEEWALISFHDDEKNALVTGYVHSQYVIPKAEADEFRLHRENLTNENNLDDTEKNPKELPDNESSRNTRNTDSSQESETIKDTNTEEQQITEQKKSEEKSQQLSQVERLRGVAAKQTTHVYAQMSTKSEVLRSYNQGHILLFQPHNSEWYSATVIVNGERLSGYIYADDVEVITQDQKQLHGFALRYVEVYSSPSRNASVLKGYRQGHGLKYRAFTSNWFEATVFVNGKAHTGYIHASDVANAPPQDNAERLKGVAKNTSTAVYSDRSKSSSVLKSYKRGHILIYRTHNSNWYEATVYINGKAHIGYIHKNDVETATLDSQQLHGIGIANPTQVFASATRSAKALKNYQQGHLLKYRSFTSNWYEATVYISGKPLTGYINVTDVETAVPSSTTLNGIGVANPTRVFDKASKRSRALKSYRQGHVLKYRSFTPNWYEATVYVNGKAHTGYIHKNHVENITDKQERVNGFAIKQPTRVYSSASRSSTTLKTYAFGSNLIYRTYTDSWYEATVYVNGKARTGYFHKNDVSVRNGKVIVLDAGHGGSDPGAIGNGLREKDITLDIAQRTKKLLEEKGFTVIMTRESDTYPSLKDRTDLANRSNADIFISIHVNAGGGTGIETWWYSKGPEPTRSEQLATSIQKHLIDKTNARNRGVKDGNLHINRESTMPSALVEVGFIDNSSDATKLKQSSYRSQIAEALMLGIIEYFS